MKIDKAKIKERIKEVSKGAGEILGKRQTKWASNTFVVIVALLGILLLVNYIVRKESGTLQWDMTKNKQYTLSQQTRKVLKDVKDDIKIIAFYRKNNPSKEQLENLLEEYQQKNSHIKVEFVDPDENPTKAKEYGITKYGTIIFQKGDKKEQSTGFTESDITSSILKLQRDKKKIVYFITGHKEKDINKSDEKGYSEVKATLEKEGFEIKTLNLITEEIPNDANVLVLAGPQKALLDQEKERLNKYLEERNGKLMALIDPRKEVKEDVKVYDLLDKWGVVLTDGMVIDPSKSFYGDVAVPVVEKWETHQITEQQGAAFFPGVLMVGKKEKTSEDILVNELGKTSKDSWLEVNLGDEKVKYDKKSSDVKGPISIAAAMHQTKKEKEGDQEKVKEAARIVVIGDSDFAVNGFVAFLGNQDLFINSIHWLAEEEELISIRPKEEDQRTIALTGRQGQLVFYTTVVIMPLVVIGIGVGVWMKRRRRIRGNIK